MPFISVRYTTWQLCLFKAKECILRIRRRLLDPSSLNYGMKTWQSGENLTLRTSTRVKPATVVAEPVRRA